MSQILKPSALRTFLSSVPSLLKPRIAHFVPVCACRREYGSYSKHRFQDRGNRKPSGVKAERSNRSTKVGWAVRMHEALVKSVDFPPVRTKGPSFYTEDYLQELSTTDLMSQARTIQKVDKESMKLIQTLWRRFDSMTVEEILTTADVFFMNGVSAPWYSSAIISYLTEMFDLLPMSPQQVARLAFHICNHRYASPYLMQTLEEHLCGSLDDFDVFQIVVICHSFFLSKTRIKSVLLLERIAEKLLSDFASVKGQYIPMLMKTFRYSDFMKVSFYKKVGDLIVKHNAFSEIRNFSDMMHVTFTYASLRITHDELFRYTLSQFLNSNRQRRLKDFTKFFWACGMLVTDSEEHVQEIHKILSQTFFLTEDVLKYPDNLAEGLLGLAYINIYPQNLLSKLFHPKVVQSLAGFGDDRTKSMQLVFLDQSLFIECPEYTGHRLSDEDKELITEQMEKFYSVEVDQKLRKGIKPVLSALQSALGQDMVACSNALPHLRHADILLTFDCEKRRFLPFPAEHFTTHNGSPIKGDDHLLRIVIILLSKAQKSFDGGRLLGLVHCKLRQLSRLGYRSIVVDAEDALRYMMMDEEEIQGDLIQRIKSCIES